MSQIQIRKATVEDLPELLAFEQGVVAAERPYDSRLKDGQVNYYDLAGLIASRESQVLVAEDAGALIATGHATLKKSVDHLAHERHAYLGLMYVEPGYRGRGLIHRIIDQLLAWARGEGVSDFYLDVDADNEPALRAYERYGFDRSLIEMKLSD